MGVAGTRAGHGSRARQKRLASPLDAMTLAPSPGGRSGAKPSPASPCNPHTLADTRADVRVTGPPEPPEELAAIERRIWRRQFRAFVIMVVIALSVTMAAVAAINHWGL
jgi:hypothetical protein